MKNPLGIMLITLILICSFVFLNQIKGSVTHIDCMIEAKKKDAALFKLMNEVKKRGGVKIIDGSSFQLL